MIYACLVFDVFLIFQFSSCFSLCFKSCFSQNCHVLFFPVGQSLKCFWHFSGNPNPKTKKEGQLQDQEGRLTRNLPHLFGQCCCLPFFCGVVLPSPLPFRVALPFPSSFPSLLGQTQLHARRKKANPDRKKEGEGRRREEEGQKEKHRKEAVTLATTFQREKKKNNIKKKKQEHT